MAKDLVILGGILCLWFTIVTLLGLMGSDPTLQSLGAGNFNSSSYQTGDNFTISGDTDVNLLTFQTSGFWGVIRSLFTFSLPSIINMPVIVGTFISFANYLIVTAAGLIGYRLIRHGGS
jgi:hypothetical protein